MTYWLRHAIVDGAVRSGVRVEHAAGVITAVVPDAEPTGILLDGLTLPGFANAHSHAFHRALRGRTHDSGGTFWTWRELMYRASAALTPESYRTLAAAAFAEMALAGYTAVGEFHYVHRAPGGAAYDPTTAMSDALMDAATAAGVRLTLLDTLYLSGGIGDDGAALPLSPEQARFSDGSVRAWAQRHARLRGNSRVVVGAAIHSVRAVDPEVLPEFLDAVGDAPIHAHVSEQPAENVQSLERYGATPVGVLAGAGVLGPAFTAVHATHLTDDDIQLLAGSGSSVCFCPSTERDLADGLGRASDLLDAGVPLAIGSDQHAVVDPFDELRQLEGHERLRRGTRGNLPPATLLNVGGRNGFRSLGWDGGSIAVGSLCDLVSVRTTSVRTAGAELSQLVLAASAADVTDTVVGGEHVVRDGRHRLGDVGALLADAIGEVLP